MRIQYRNTCDVRSQTRHDHTAINWWSVKQAQSTGNFADSRHGIDAANGVAYPHRRPDMRARLWEPLLPVKYRVAAAGPSSPSVTTHLCDPSTATTLPPRLLPPRLLPSCPSSSRCHGFPTRHWPLSGVSSRSPLTPASLLLRGSWLSPVPVSGAFSNTALRRSTLPRLPPTPSAIAPCRPLTLAFSTMRCGNCGCTPPSTPGILLLSEPQKATLWRALIWAPRSP